MGGKVRPFARWCDFGGKPTMVRGVIEDGRFVITAELIRLEVPILQKGRDERGDFAVIDEGEWALPDGTMLKVQPRYDSMPFADGSHRPPGLEISRVKSPSPQTVGDLEVRAVMETGQLPGSFNLIVPNTWGFIFQFDSMGNHDGFGAVL